VQGETETPPSMSSDSCVVWVPAPGEERTRHRGARRALHLRDVLMTSSASRRCGRTSLDGRQSVKRLDSVAAIDHQGSDRGESSTRLARSSQQLLDELRVTSGRSCSIAASMPATTVWVAGEPPLVLPTRADDSAGSFTIVDTRIRRSGRRRSQVILSASRERASVPCRHYRPGRIRTMAGARDSFEEFEATILFCPALSPGHPTRKSSCWCSPPAASTIHVRGVRPPPSAAR